MRTNGERQTGQLNAKTRERKAGPRRGLKQCDRRQDDEPARHQQEKTNESHENYDYYNNPASTRAL